MKEIGAHKITEASVSEQVLTDRERALVDEVYATLDVYERECKAYHEKAMECRDILRLKDPGQDDPDSDHVTLQLQTLKSTFNACVAEMIQNIPTAKLDPETPQMEELARDLQDVVNFIVYTQNNYEDVYRRRAEDFYAVGTSVTQIVWDETMNGGRGDVALIRWPLENFLWDPRAENIQEGRANIKVSWHPLSWYTAHYPDAAPYVRGEDGTHTVGLPRVQQTKLGDDEPRAMMLEYWYRRYDAKKKKYTINVAYCAGGALLDHEENVFRHGMYPFVLDVHDTIEGTPVGDSLVAELTPMMRYINRYADYIDTNLRMSAKGRILIRRDSGIDRRALADWKTDIVESDRVAPGEDWTWMQHAPFNGMIAQQMLQFQSDLKRDSGANEYMRGESDSKYLSGRAVEALQAAGSKTSNMRLNTLKNGFREAMNQVIELIAEFYTDERTFMITGKDGTHRQIVASSKLFFGGEEAGIHKYIVQVEINRRDPALVEARNQMYMQAYTMAAQAQQFFPLSSLFRLMNFEGRDRVLPVVEQNETYQQQMQELAMQNQQLQEQLAMVQQEAQNLKIANEQTAAALAKVSATQERNTRYPGIPRSIPTETREDSMEAAVMAARDTGREARGI